VPRKKSKEPTRAEYVGVRVGEQMKTDLQQIAAAEARTISQVCEMLLAFGIGRYKKTRNLDFARAGKNDE
jgi:hypothetical protein